MYKTLYLLKLFFAGDLQTVTFNGVYLLRFLFGVFV